MQISQNTLVMVSDKTIGDFRNVFKLMDILLPKPSAKPFDSPTSFNVISIAGIHFAYISCATSDKPRTSFAVVKNNLLLTEYA